MPVCAAIAYLDGSALPVPMHRTNTWELLMGRATLSFSLLWEQRWKKCHSESSR